MENRKVLWTQNGRRHVSVCSYDKASAQQRADELQGQATDIVIVTVKPGETVEVDQPRTGRIVQRKHTRSTS
jgi:hypothetical protein